MDAASAMRDATSITGGGILLLLVIDSNTMFAENSLQECVRSWLILTGNGRITTAIEVGNVLFHCNPRVLLLVFDFVLSHRSVSL